jgi:tetratricopeptide (TPR) repeat protein
MYAVLRSFGLSLSLIAGALSAAATTDSTILKIQDEIKSGALDQAAIDIQSALKTDPRNGGLYNLRGILHANRQEVDAAAKDFNRAIELSPELTGAYLNFGRACEILASQDKTALDRAITRYEQLRRLQPGNTAILLPLQKTYELAGRLDEARKVAEQVAKNAPSDVDALLELARIARLQSDSKGALGYLAHARELAPANPQVHFFFGVVCIEMNLVVEAKKSLDRALELVPTNPWFNYARGSVELQGRSAWLAIPYFKKALAADPTNPRIHFALGVAQFASQDYESAKVEMTAIAQNKDTVGGAEYFLGRIAKTESDWAAAARHLQASVAAEPNYAESHAELGLAQLKLGDIVTAKSEMARALQINPNSYLANVDLLALYERTKDPAASAQREKLQAMDQQRSERQELMVRTIKVLP